MKKVKYKNKRFVLILIASLLGITGLTIGWFWYFTRATTHHDAIVKSQSKGTPLQLHSRNPTSSTNLRTPDPLTDELHKTWVQKGSRIDPEDLAIRSRKLAQGEGKPDMVVDQTYALLTYDPRRFYDVEHAIGDVKDKAGAEALGRMIQVLALVDDSAAVEVLVDVARKYIDDEFLTKNIIYALHDVHVPDQNIVQLAFGYIRQTKSAVIRDMAILSLGSMVGHARDKGLPAYAEVVAKLEELYGNDHTRLSALSAMGNAADPKFIEHLRQSTGSSREAERVDAATSLRFYDQPEAYAGLARLLNDNSMHVRRSALTALRFHSHDTQALHLTMAHLNSEPEESNRILALNVLAGNRSLDPDRVGQRIKDAALNDVSAEVRKVAEQLRRVHGS